MYRRAAQAAGHELEMHSGHVGGRGTDTLERLVARADVLIVLIVLTDVNSHGTVHTARRLAHRRGVRELLLRRCGVVRFVELLNELSLERERS